MSGEIYEVRGELKWGPGPGCPEELAGKTVRLESLEGAVFELPTEAACLAQRVRSLALEQGCEQAFKFEVKKPILAKICEYMKYHKDVQCSEIKTPLEGDNLQDSGASRWDNSFVNVDKDTLFELGLAAQSLAIPSLHFLITAKIQLMNSNKSADKLRKEYNMVNDIPAHEEAELRRAYNSSRKKLGQPQDSNLSRLAAMTVARSGMEAAKRKVEAIKDGSVAEPSIKVKDIEETVEEDGSNWDPKSWRYAMWHSAIMDDWKLLADAPEEVKNERKLVKTAIMQSQGAALRHASIDLRSDEQIVLLAISFFGVALADAAPELRQSRDFVLKAVGQHGAALVHASDALRSDKTLLLQAAKESHGSALQGASDALRSDSTFILELLVHDAEAYQFISEELRSDREFAIEAAKRNGTALKFMDSKFQADPEVVRSAASRDPQAVTYAHTSRRRDMDVEEIKYLGEKDMAQEYDAQVKSGLKAAQDATTLANSGPHQVAVPAMSDAPRLTTLKLAKFVGFSAGSTAFGNMGQGNYVAANAFVDILPSRQRPELDTSILLWGAVGGGIGMRFKAFASADVLNQQEDALLTLEDATKAVKYTCAKMDSVPLVMPSKFDQYTRQEILAPRAGMIKLEISNSNEEVVMAAESNFEWMDRAEAKDKEALKQLSIVDRRPIPENMSSESPTSPLGGWPNLLRGKPRELEVGTRIRLTGLRAKNGVTGTLVQKFGDGKWKVTLDDNSGSALLREENFEMLEPKIDAESNWGPWKDPSFQRDLQARDMEAAALRRSKIQQKRTELQEKLAARGKATERITATSAATAVMDTTVASEEHLGHGQRKQFFIAGTWNSWELEEMAWCQDRGCYSFCFAAGSSGREAFQVLLDTTWNSCLHPGEKPRRAPQGGVRVMGPDPKWKCEGFNFPISNAKAGSRYGVKLFLNAKGMADKVEWAIVS